MLGKHFAHNSERDLPKTTFSKGIFEGKIMGKEYSGVLLVVLGVLYSSMGREKLRKKANFNKIWLIEDWCMLVETLLQWEEFLKLEKMPINKVRKLRNKHRFLMHLIKKVLRRTSTALCAQVCPFLLEFAHN